VRGHLHLVRVTTPPNGSAAVAEEAALEVVGATEDESTAVAEGEEERITRVSFLAPVRELAEELPGTAFRAPGTTVEKHNRDAEKILCPIPIRREVDLQASQLIRSVRRPVTSTRAH
jgi:hypothetical protein